MATLEEKRQEWISLNAKFQSLVSKNNDWEIPKVNLAINCYQDVANKAYLDGRYDDMEKAMVKFCDVANWYIKQNNDNSEWNAKTLPSQESKSEVVDLCKKLGYASSGQGITRSLNSVQSDLVKYKPYNNLTKEIAASILHAIAPVNKKAKELLKKINTKDI